MYDRTNCNKCVPVYAVSLVEAALLFSSNLNLYQCSNSHCQSLTALHVVLDVASRGPCQIRWKIQAEEENWWRVIWFVKFTTLSESSLWQVVGEVYLGNNIMSNQQVAIKLEHIEAEESQLQSEFEIYTALRGVIGIPSVHWFGTEADYNALVIDLLGPSLEDVFAKCNRQFSLKTVALLANQLVCTFRLPNPVHALIQKPF